MTAGEFVCLFVLVMIESWFFTERFLLWPNVTSCCDVAMAKTGNIWSKTRSLRRPSEGLFIASLVKGDA